MIGTELLSWPRIRGFEGSGDWLRRLVESGAETWRVGPATVEGRIYGGQVMPLRHDRAPDGRAGEAHGAILVLEDLTEQRDLEERLRRAENLAAVGRMSAQVAHEVRNPLHSIGLEAELALDTASKLGQSGLRQSLQSILSAVDRLEKITENYLKLSRLSAGEKTRVNLGEILESVLATYASACESQGVRVDWSRAPRANLDVHGDRDLLEQVLGNLVRNSLQALTETTDPRISVALGAAESGRVWLRIEDNGPGVPPEVEAKLFTPFVTTRAQGTGLGLSFVKKVVEDHEGSIELRKRPVGAGACFELVLPQATPGAVTGKMEVTQDARV